MPRRTPATLYHDSMERPRSPRIRPGAASSRTIGIIAAATTGVASLVVFALVLRGGKPTTAPEQLGSPSPLDQTLATNRPTTTVGIANTRNLHLEFADRDDPTRLSHVVDFGSVDPQRGAQYAVEEVSAWVFLQDGRTLHVQAPRGRVIMPDRQDLQSGTLLDGVTIRLFEPQGDGSRPRPGVDRPVLIARTPTLAFDLPRSTAVAKERLVVNGEQVDFAGSDVLIVFDEQDQTIRRLEVGRGERLAFRPKPQDEPAPAQQPTAQQPTAPQPVATTESTASARSGPAASAPQPLVATADAEPNASNVDDARPAPVVFYHALVRDNVTLTQRGRIIRGGQIDVWAKTVGGELAPDAFGPIDSQQASALPSGLPSGLPALPRSAPASDVASLIAASAVAVQPSAGDDLLMPARLPTDDEVELTWSGRLVLVPVDTRPDALTNRNDLHVRVTDASGDGIVELEDPGSGAIGRCATLDYAASIQEVELTGPGPRAVRLELKDRGTVEGQRMTLGLSDSVARVVGPGQLVGAAAQANAVQRRVSWTELARFELTPAGDGAPARLERARFVGSVEATDADARLMGGRLDATFRDAENGPFEIASLDVTEGVRVGDGAGSTVTARRLLANFTSDRAELGDTLSFVGDVLAQREGTELRSQTLDAALVREQDGKARIGGVDARDSVRFERRSDQLIAIADRLVGDAEQERVELTGDFVLLSRGPSRIRAAQAMLDGRARTMEVFGEGVYEQVDQQGRAQATVVWSDGMIANDGDGMIEASGNAFARWRAGPAGVDDILAERIRVTYDEAAEGDPLAFERPSSSRQITRVIAMGGQMINGDGKPAILQSLREVGSDDGTELERLFRLEGPEIIADNRAGTLIVEHPGRLVLADLRPDGAEAGTPTPSDPGTIRGSALFDWSGQMTADRAAGTILMVGDVRMTHARLVDGLRTDLFADRLLARFRETQTIESELMPLELGPPRETVSLELELESVTGEGAVSLLSGDRELQADRLDYDAARGLVEAQALGEGRVSMFDPSRVTPIRARGILWDLTTDRIDIQRPDPFVQPR